MSSDARSVATLYPATPSRHSNPFATCWTRPGALPFRFSNGDSAEMLIQKLASQNLRGAIIGPHGSGKSTLLETLKPAIAAASRTVVSVSLHDGEHRLPSKTFRSLNSVAEFARIQPRSSVDRNSCEFRYERGI